MRTTEGEKSLENERERGIFHSSIKKIDSSKILSEFEAVARRFKLQADFYEFFLDTGDEVGELVNNVR